MATRIPGVKSVLWSYRRTRKEMPADLEELTNAIEEARALQHDESAVPFNPNTSNTLIELTLPEAMQPGSVTLRRMKLAEKDASGRRSPVPTEETLDLPCDLMITAVGEKPDPTFLAAFGIEVDKNGLPAVDEVTMQTSVPGIYVCGDARRGPSSIIASEADGRAAAMAILKNLGIETASADYRAPAWSSEARASRGKILPSLDPSDPGFAAREAERCLSCDTACLRCVEVCPNRANMVIDTDRLFDQPAQILHIDRLCNECGNCGLFCPWNGEPYNDKPTLFDSKDDLTHSKNAGFAFAGNKARPFLVLRAEKGGAVVELPYLAWNGAISVPAQRPMIALARTVWADHRYLVEVHE
jgi:putative selenate reductase